MLALEHLKEKSLTICRADNKTKSPLQKKCSYAKGHLSASLAVGVLRATPHIYPNRSPICVLSLSGVRSVDELMPTEWCLTQN